MKIDKKDRPQILFRRMQIYGLDFIWSRQMSRFTELKSDSESSASDLDSEKIGAKVDKELMAKLEKFGSDSE